MATQTMTPAAPALPELEVAEPRLVVRFTPTVELADDKFYQFCRLNADLRIERTAKGEIIIMPPAGGETGSRNLSVGALLWNWARQDGRGIAFDSSTGFILPNGATGAPDAAWVRRERLAELTPAQKEKFLPLCADFVVELRSPTDRVADLQAKLIEYIENGAQLGWLLIPATHTVVVYRPAAQPTILVNPDTITAEPLLPGLTLQLAAIWDPGF